MALPEGLPLWAYGYAAAFALVHGAVLYYLYRSTASTPSDDAADTESEATTVVCEHCGTENDLEYRFCRNCVQELSGPSGSDAGDGKPASPGIL
ncbi:hypothetical protein ACFQDG_16845 [Natronoarchaeum mannanilyticum]|uniref:DUF7577 domain-containing protein n=1 Tax=Natronoarchaeum mannanilyticum TaxID=926360 RepID=A0AAV3T5R5_9EURY